MKNLSLGISLLVALCLNACSTNPVTGESEFSLVSEEQEVNIGNQQYQPTKQSQGGDYDVDEDLSAYVNEVGQRLAAVSDRDLPYEFSVLNNGVPNAWALPGGKISVNRGLLVELDNEAELAAVLAHEIVHAAARHSAQAVTRGTLLQGALIAGAIGSQDSDYSNLIVGGAQVGAQLINQGYGRDAERESDRYGIEYMLEAGYDPEAAVSLQETFVRLSEENNPGWLQGLFASHPPSQERVENNREMVEALQPQIAGRDMELGRERYQQQIAFLKESQPAYDLFDEAQENIANDDLDAAMDKARQASEMVPQEARFIGLQGDILFYRNQYRDAIEAYDQALRLDDDYFDYYLGRGVSWSRLGSAQEARRDLEQSAELLPTAIAMNELGKIELDSGNRNQAIEYFQVAASGEGPVSREAREYLIRLDLPNNPGNYVQTQPMVANNNRLVARVTNPTHVDMQNVTVEFATAVNGQTGRQRRTVSSLPAGASVDVDSGITLPAGQQPQVSISVSSATVE